MSTSTGPNADKAASLKTRASAGKCALIALARSAPVHFLRIGVVFRNALANSRGWAPSTAFLTNPTFLATPWATSKGGGALSLSSSAAAGAGAAASAISMSLAMVQARPGARALRSAFARRQARPEALASLNGQDSLCVGAWARRPTIDRGVNNLCRTSSGRRWLASAASRTARRPDLL